MNEHELSVVRMSTTATAATTSTTQPVGKAALSSLPLTNPVGR